jgi:hypothetical protein
VEKFLLEEKLLLMDILLKHQKKILILKKLMEQDIFVQEILEKFFLMEQLKLLVKLDFFIVFICFLNLDRKKDLIKLRGGEYVSLTKVEMAISKIPIIENCCLCASASSEYTVLLISPNVKQMAVSFFFISLLKILSI